jgi:cyclophilin family peptidyl-prolyl cis-trans isomerase
MRSKIFLLVMLAISVIPVSAQTKKAMQEKETVVEMTTDMGVIRLKLYNETPLHRDNFIKLVKEGFYDSLLFHRVINSFMIQGGDPQSKNAQAGQMLGNGDVGYKIPAEIKDSLFHKRGALAAARDNNPEKASSGCQFYIVHGRKFNDNELAQMEQRSGVKLTPAAREAYKTVGGSPWLDGAYTVFGEVISGIEVVDQIATSPVGMADRPVKDIRFSIKMVEN